MSPPEITPDAPKAALDRAVTPSKEAPCRRDYLGNRYVSIELSPRARGLSIGIDLAPLHRSSEDGVPAKETGRPLDLEVPVMLAEMTRTLALVQSGGVRELAGYENLPAELLSLRHVSIGGDSEPTQSPKFVEALEALVHLRALTRFPFFKLILSTNACEFHRPEVIEALRLFTPRDEIWVRYDPESSRPADPTAPPTAELRQQISRLARQRPVILQGHFSAVPGESPVGPEIEAYAQSLKAMKDDGAKIPLVQVYSESGPNTEAPRNPLPLRTLFDIARHVRTVSGLTVEVF